MVVRVSPCERVRDVLANICACESRLDNDDDEQCEISTTTTHVERCNYEKLSTSNVLLVRHRPIFTTTSERQLDVGTSTTTVYENPYGPVKMMIPPSDEGETGASRSRRLKSALSSMFRGNKRSRSKDSASIARSASSGTSSGAGSPQWTLAPAPMRSAHDVSFKGLPTPVAAASMLRIPSPQAAISAPILEEKRQAPAAPNSIATPRLAEDANSDELAEKRLGKRAAPLPPTPVKDVRSSSAASRSTIDEVTASFDDTIEHAERLLQEESEEATRRAILVVNSSKSPAPPPPAFYYGAEKAADAVSDSSSSACLPHSPVATATSVQSPQPGDALTLDLRSALNSKLDMADGGGPSDAEVLKRAAAARVTVEVEVHRSSASEEYTIDVADETPQTSDDTSSNNAAPPSSSSIDEPQQQWRRASPSDSPTTLDADADQVQHEFLELQERSLSVQRQLLALDLHSPQARQEASALRAEQARLQRHLELCHTRTRDVAAVKKQARERLQQSTVDNPQSHRSIEIDFRPSPIHSQHSHVMRALEAQLSSSSLNTMPREAVKLTKSDPAGKNTSRIVIQFGKMSSATQDDSAVESAASSSSSSTEPPPEDVRPDIPLAPPMPPPALLNESESPAASIPVPPPPPDLAALRSSVRSAVKAFEGIAALQSSEPTARVKRRPSASDGTSVMRNALLDEIKTFQRRELKRANGAAEPNSWTYH